MDMIARSAFFFWLGRLDTCVAAGEREVAGGTRDIRFCRAEQAIRDLLRGVSRLRSRQWRFVLQPYPEAGIPQWPIRFARYGGRRPGECAMPAQSAYSPDAYPLWRKLVQVLPEGEEPLQSILFLRDADGGIHARVLHWRHVASVPGPLHDALAERDQCGRHLDLSANPLEWRDLPLIVGDTRLPPFDDVRTEEHEDEWMDRVRHLGAPAGAHETRERRRLRSRQLADEMKRHYGYQCQLCGPDAPRIDMGGGQYYVEIHHILGLAETERSGRVHPHEDHRQDARHYQLDSFTNIVVVCAYHHKLLHYYYSGFVFERRTKRFAARDGSLTLELVRNDHL